MISECLRQLSPDLPVETCNARSFFVDGLDFVRVSNNRCVCLCMVNDGDDDERGLMLLAGFLRADSVAFALASRYRFIMDGELCGRFDGFCRVGFRI